MNQKNKRNLSIKPDLPIFISYDRLQSNTTSNSKLYYLSNPLSSNTRPNTSKRRNTKLLCTSKRQYSSSDISIGERLYRRGLAKKDETQFKLNEMKKGLLKQEMSQCTFKPKTLKVVSIKAVNSNTNIFNKKNCTTTKSKKNNDTPTNNTIPIYNNRKNKPKYNKKELILHSIKLYNDNQRMKTKRKNEIEMYFKTNYTFKPRISKSQDKVPARTMYLDNSAQNVPNTFFTRLQFWINKHSMNQIKREEQTMYDEKTGLRLFIPHLITKNTTEEEEDNHHRKFSKLFQDADNRNEKNRLRETEYNDEIYKMANSTYFSPRSREIINSLLKKIFSRIFTIISPNGDFIDKNNIELDKIDVKVIEMFFPLLYELEKHNGGLNEEEFFYSCMEMYKTFTIYEKNILIEWYFSLLKKENDSSVFNSNFTFKPKINSYYVNTNNIKQYKKEEHKAKEYCTFRPKSLSNSSTARFRKQIDTNTYSIPKNKITEEEK